jgi:hypothetical protein
MTRTIALALGFTIITNGHTVTLPDIGNAQYTRSCQVTRNHEDDVLARCREDGVTYRYDFDGSPHIERDYGRIPAWSAGWYEVQS